MDFDSNEILDPDDDLKFRLSKFYENSFDKSGRKFNQQDLLSQDVFFATARDQENQTLLHILCENTLIDNLAIPVGIALQNNADPNALDCNNNTPLHLICNYYLGYYGYDELKIIKILLDGGAYVDGTIFQEINTPLILASDVCEAEEFCPPIAELLIKRGAGVNVPGINGATPLHYACARDDIKLAELLIIRGASKHIKTKKQFKVHVGGHVAVNVPEGSTPEDVAYSGHMRDLLIKS